jgi:hypothetical protein
VARYAEQVEAGQEIDFAGHTKVNCGTNDFGRTINSIHAEVEPEA